MKENFKKRKFFEDKEKPKENIKKTYKIKNSNLQKMIEFLNKQN